ncbi:MAG: hypothetical protein KGL39_56750 [Patescibacteria group bacterium]|nr:hypothetical protein [Patescibacteria group bacterium]
MDLSSMVSSDHTFGSDAMVVVTVEYFKDGLVKVHGNLQGKGSDDILLAILQGAMEAVRSGARNVQ